MSITRLSLSYFKITGWSMRFIWLLLIISIPMISFTRPVFWANVYFKKRNISKKYSNEKDKYNLHTLQRGVMMAIDSFFNKFTEYKCPLLLGLMAYILCFTSWCKKESTILKLILQLYIAKFIQYWFCAGALVELS